VIPVYVATGPQWAEHEPVLAYSILRHATQTVRIHFIDPTQHGMKKAGCTGFSHVRWAIPELAGEGYAIYLDVDMLLLADIAALFAYRQPRKYVCLADGSTEVMVMDCSRKMYPKETLADYGKQHLHSRAAPWLVPTISLDWNSEDKITPTTKLLHFTDLNMQPWLGHDHKDADCMRVLHDYQNDYEEKQAVGLAGIRH
jgi:lipopolysaccharide biosynthesis glycosyltransferase